jgi:polysaccharide pyruvyl transferase WcaK-like protein
MSFGKILSKVNLKLQDLVLGDRKHPKRCEPRTILANENADISLAHVAVFQPRGYNAGDILLPVVLRDLFVREKKSGIHWKTLHAHRTVNTEILSSINSSNGLVIGGGGLFLKDTNKNNISGWQWACSEHQLDMISVPLCVFAVGYNRFRGQEDFDEVFSKNLTVLTNKAIFIGLRNHGSINAVRKYLPEKLHDKIIFQPCMTTLLKKIYTELFAYDVNKTEEFIAINCAFDRKSRRFGSNIVEIQKTIAQSLKYISINTGLKIRYYSHCTDDLDMVDCLKSEGVKFTFCDISLLSPIEIINAYRTPSLVIGMRGHSQMIPFGCGTPILSLISHDKMKWFLEDINQKSWGVEISDNNLFENLIERSLAILDRRSSIISDITNQHERLFEISRVNVNKFFESITK